MLFVGLSFPKIPAKSSTPARNLPRFDRIVDATVVPAPFKERHWNGPEVGGLGHYIDSRLSGGLFRID